MEYLLMEGKNTPLKISQVHWQETEVCSSDSGRRSCCWFPWFERKKEKCYESWLILACSLKQLHISLCFPKKCAKQKISSLQIFSIHPPWTGCCVNLTFVASKAGIYIDFYDSSQIYKLCFFLAISLPSHRLETHVIPLPRGLSTIQLFVWKIIKL